ncbi:hypothetical protein BKA93DRAFT_745896 [Sparassis latifolia]
MSLRCQASVQELPEEIFSKILNYFGGQPNVPRRYRIAHVLSQVSRHLQAIAFCFLVRDIAVRNCSLAYSAIHSFNATVDNARFVRIGSTNYGYMPNKMWTPNFPELALHLNLMVWPFTNLRSFCFSWCSSFVFPDLDGWPELQVLRIYPYSRNKHDQVACPSMPKIYSKLMTLAVHTVPSSPWWSNHIGMLTFPHLRVLSLQHEASSPEDVYGFIHRHSSLLEVNVSFSSFRHFLSLESLMLLVEGTGIWTHQFTSGDEHERDMSQGVHLDSPYTPYPLTLWSQLSNIGFKSFAFTRVPLAFDPTHSSQGPLYELTRLALPVKI